MAEVATRVAETLLANSERVEQRACIATQTMRGGGR
jgi:hypothetical protein